jgi:hypothetical protein
MKTIYKYSLSILLGFGAILSTFAQGSYVFKVLGTSGSVKKHTSAGDATLTAGTKLLDNESIIIEGSGYCGLIHSSGKGLEVKKPGVYTIADLSKSVVASNKQSKVSDRYVNYVMGQLTKEEAEDISQNYRKHMEVTGSVERASVNYRIKLIALSTNEIQPRSYTLSWTSNSKDSEYLLEVHNLFSENVFTAKTKENSAAIDFGPLFAKHGKNLIVSVKVVGHPEIKSKEYSFKAAPETLTNELGLSSDKTPAAFMVNGMICEENNLFIDALAYYRDAASQETEVQEYKNAYNNLLKRLSDTK